MIVSGYLSRLILPGPLADLAFDIATAKIDILQQAVFEFCQVIPLTNTPLPGQ